MEKEQINRMEMLATTRMYLDNHTSVWSSIPIVSQFKSRLDSIINEIITHQEAQQASKVFLGSNKASIKKTVAKKADILNDVLSAYAAVEENYELEQKADKSFTTLYRLTNQDFTVVISETIELLEFHLQDIADYGVNPDQLEDLKSSFDDFLEIYGKPRQYKIQSSQATQALEDVFAEASQLLERKLDRVMKRFKNSNTNFYNGYLAARVIVN